MSEVQLTHEDKSVAQPARSFERPDFPYTTPMLVMSIADFKRLGRIMKSTTEWRERALRKGLLQVYDPSKHVAIFISHTWWDRAFKDASNNPKDPYDKGAPDYQTGEKKDRKWRTICAGVDNLIAKQALERDKVMLWVDWFSIHQGDRPLKLKGVESLIKYTTMCRFMLIPTEERELDPVAANYPEEIPAYGARAWCRSEYFIFSLWNEMQPEVGEVQLYAIADDGGLHQYPAVKVEGEQYMPSGGDLSNPADKQIIRQLEGQMVEAYGNALIWKLCAAGKEVDLTAKMIRPVHTAALTAAAAEHGVEALKLDKNDLGSEGAVAVVVPLLKAAPKLRSLR